MDDAIGAIIVANIVTAIVVFAVYIAALIAAAAAVAAAGGTLWGGGRAIISHGKSIKENLIDSNRKTVIA